VRARRRIGPLVVAALIVTSLGVPGSAALATDAPVRHWADGFWVGS
jgi:hypothetical protein